MPTLVQLTIANLKSLTRDRAALFWTVFFPIMFVLLFGAIFSGNRDTRIRVGFVDQDGSQASAGLRQAFAAVEILTLVDGTLETERDLMQHGDVAAIVVVPRGLQAAVAQPRGSAPNVACQLYVDPSQTQSTQLVEGVVSQVLNGFNLAASGASPILSVQEQTLQSTSTSTVAYLVPSILAMALMQLGVFAAIPLVQQREKGILKRIGATPLARWKLIASNVLLRLCVAVVDTFLILGIGRVVFGVELAGNPLVAAAIVLLGATTFLALGFLVASFVRTEEQATGVVQFVQLPMMFLSGIFFSFNFLPAVLQSIARLLPLTYLGDALRQEMVNGTQLAPLSVDVAILAGWLVVCLAISARAFRWD